jgi:hypothetical protein
MHKGRRCVVVRQERTVEAGALEAKVDSVKAANGPATLQRTASSLQGPCQCLHHKVLRVDYLRTPARHATITVKGQETTITALFAAVSISCSHYHEQ